MRRGRLDRGAQILAAASSLPQTPLQAEARVEHALRKGDLVQARRLTAARLMHRWSRTGFRTFLLDACALIDDERARSDFVKRVNLELRVLLTIIAAPSV
jgi:hypothetical protein